MKAGLGCKSASLGVGSINTCHGSTELRAHGHYYGKPNEEDCGDEECTGSPFEEPAASPFQTKSDNGDLSEPAIDIRSHIMSQLVATNFFQEMCKYANRT